MKEDERRAMEEVEQELYSREGPDPDKVHDLRAEAKPSVPETWQTPRPVIPNKTFIERTTHKASKVAQLFFVFSVLALVVALGMVAYMFFGPPKSFSNDRVDVRILGATFSDGGAPLPITVEVKNRNTTQLINASVIVEIEKDKGAGGSGDYERLPKADIGSVDPNKTVTSQQTIVLYGEEGTAKKVRAVVEYTIPNSNATFTKVSEMPVLINRAPVVLSIDGPLAASPNQPIEMKIKATSNANEKISNLLLRVDYPPGFVLETADPQPTYGSNVWVIDELSKGSEKEITFTGMLKAWEGEARVFKVSSGLESVSDKTKIGLVYNSLLHNLILEKPFIAVQSAINGQSVDEPVIDQGRVVGVTLTYTNTLDTPVTDTAIHVTFSGNAFEGGKVESEKGFYDSNTRTIIFDKTNTPQLAVLEPGQSGGVGFGIVPGPIWTGTTLLKDPVVSYTVKVSGKPAGYGEILEATNVERKVAKIASMLQLTVETLYHGTTFQNTGPLPPQAGKETTYTITWGIKNTSGVITNTEVRAVLPTYVTYKNKTFPSSENITYDPTSRTLVWKAGKIQQGAGLTKADKTVSFQVGIVPSTSQIGEKPELLLNVEAEGIDAFTGLPLRASRSKVTTSLTDGTQNGQVVQ